MRSTRKPGRGAASRPRKPSRGRPGTGAEPIESDTFRLLASHAPVGIFLSDAGGDLRFVNQHWCMLAGMTAEHALGRGWLAALHPDDRPRVAQAWTAAIARGDDSAVEFRFRTAAGRVAWVRARTLAMRGPSGRITGFVGTVADMTEQRRALEELAAQRAFLRQVIDLDPNFVFAKDREGRFTLVNQAVADAYGTTVENLIGRTDADFNPNAEEVRNFRRDDLEVMDTKRDKLIPEEVITDASGHVRYLQTIKRAIISPDGTADQVLGVASDITARKKLEEQLLHSQKMEAIGRLAGGIAHDFNNLLTVVLGSIGMVLEGLGPGHRLRSNAEEIQNAAERAAMLTQQLLAFGRKQVLQPRVLDLSQVVMENVSMVRRLIGEDIELITEFESPLGNVKVDLGQITQVMLNLAINARDAMPRGGKLSIEVANASLDESYAAVHPDVAPGPYVMIAMTDTGHGIPPEILPRIFEPFFTTRDVGQGTGLGLSTAYGIVRQSGGHISVRSERGRGTTFRVFLPRVEADASSSQPPATDTLPSGQETILLVEDETMVRHVAARSLRRRGYQVLEARDGADALRVAVSHPGPIHLLVADLVMPRMGGMELGARLLRMRPSTKVLYTSGYAGNERDLRVEMDPPVGFLAKPYLPETLTRRVREVLDRD